MRELNNIKLRGRLALFPRSGSITLVTVAFALFVLGVLLGFSDPFSSLLSLQEEDVKPLDVKDVGPGPMADDATSSFPSYMVELVPHPHGDCDPQVVCMGSHGVLCGTVRACKREVNCGGCSQPETCGGGGQPNRCGCSPITCEALQRACGMAPDGCGGMILCGPPCETPLLSLHPIIISTTTLSKEEKEQGRQASGQQQHVRAPVRPYRVGYYRGPGPSSSSSSRSNSHGNNNGNDGGGASPDDGGRAGAGDMKWLLPPEAIRAEFFSHVVYDSVEVDPHTWKATVAPDPTAPAADAREEDSGDDHKDKNKKWGVWQAFVNASLTCGAVPMASIRLAPFSVLNTTTTTTTSRAAIAVGPSLLSRLSKVKSAHAKFAWQLAEWMSEHGFRGAELQWEDEGMATVSGSDVAAVVAALRTALDERKTRDGVRYWLSVAVGPAASAHSYTMKAQVAQAVDWISIPPAWPPPVLPKYMKNNNRDMGGQGSRGKGRDDSHGTSGSSSTTDGAVASHMWQQQQLLLLFGRDGEDSSSSSSDDAVLSAWMEQVPAGRLLLGLPAFGALWTWQGEEGGGGGTSHAEEEEKIKAGEDDAEKEEEKEEVVAQRPRGGTATQQTLTLQRLPFREVSRRFAGEGAVTGVYHPPSASVSAYAHREGKLLWGLYNDGRTMALKVDSVVHRGLAGYGLWDMNMDDDFGLSRALAERTMIPRPVQYSPGKVVVVSSGYTRECRNVDGDSLLGRSLRNKIDFAQRNAYGVMYNVAEINPDGMWTKQPLFKYLLKAHPEVEWFFWVDGDAFITDLQLEIPFHKYVGYNLVVPGSGEKLLSEARPNWCLINAGVFLIRNSRWAMEFLDEWWKYGDPTKKKEHTELFTADLSGRDGLSADDQSALAYILRKNKTFAAKTFFENSYALHGYWKFHVNKYASYFTDAVETESGYIWNSAPYGQRRPPFMSHFVGCKMCSAGGHYNQSECFTTMDQALNFAENQHLKGYGLEHGDLEKSEVRRRRRRSLAKPTEEA